MRVVVLFPGALGDLCLLAPALRALATRAVRVELSVRRVLMPVAAMLLPDVALGPPIDGAAMATLFGDAIDPAIAGWLAGADRVHAWLARANADGTLTARFAALAIPVALHAVPREHDERHASEDYAVALGVPELVVTIAVPPAASVAMPWRGSEGRRLVLHPGAGARAKIWPAEGFVKVADDWRHVGGEVAVLLGPAEEDDAGVWTRSGYEPIVGRSLVDAAALAASAPSWIGNDSGMSHLAGALGRRGVVVFRATRPARWRPLGGRLAVIECGRRSHQDVAREALALLSAPFPASVP